MKNKILSLFFSCFLVFGSISSSFANPIVLAPISISYNSLMALMGIGVAFGVSLPQTDEEYWDYTRSLRDHLNLVDEKYLERLDKIVGEWDVKNGGKPDNEKEPLKIPFIPALDDLFKKVGEDVSSNYTYLNNLINPLPVGKSKAKYYTIKFGDSLVYEFVNSHGMKVSTQLKVTKKDNTVTFESSPSFNGDLGYGWLKYQTNVDIDSVKVGICSIGGIFHYIINGSESMATVGAPAGYSTLDSDVYVKPSIPYSPSLPNIENEELILPDLPNVDLPNIESLPSYRPGVEPPFVVNPSDSPSDDPSDSPSDDPSDSPSNSPVYDSITDFIVGLVVPSDTYWTDTWSGLYDNFTNSFPMVDMDGFNDLVTGEKKFPNIDVDIMGVTGRVVNGDVINSIVDWLRPIIAGFMMLCLMLFNYRKIYKLIRNSEPFGGIASGTSDFRTGISEYNKEPVIKAVDMAAEYRAWKENGGK